MRQRVAICRALINDPAVLLMDEPFSALDTITREQMTVLLMTLWEEVRKSALFVTHSIREAVYLSDRVLVMGQAPLDRVLDRAHSLSTAASSFHRRDSRVQCHLQHAPAENRRSPGRLGGDASC